MLLTTPKEGAPAAGPEAQATRHEIKFVLSQAYAAPALEWLDHHCAPDPRYSHNMVHSVYFDTPHLGLYHQKLQSEYLKYKVRLRWYSNEEETSFSDGAFLEIKSKEGVRSRKGRVHLAPDMPALQRDPLGAARRLAEDEEGGLEHEVYTELHKLTPVCVIRYCRRRFIDMLSGHRIALDHHIGVTHVNPDLRLRDGGRDLDSAVLEIKGRDARSLPPSLYELTTLTRARRDAFSKYGECVRQLLI